jgi:hypothetical protein
MRGLQEKIFVGCSIRIYQKYNGLDPKNAVKKIIMKMILGGYKMNIPFKKKGEKLSQHQRLKRYKQTKKLIKRLEMMQAGQFTIPVANVKLGESLTKEKADLFLKKMAELRENHLNLSLLKITYRGIPAWPNS